MRFRAAFGRPRLGNKTTMSDMANIALVTVEGDLDVRTVPALRRRIDRLVAGGCRRIFLNMAGARYVDSAGMGLMSFLPLVALLNYFLFCGGELFYSVLPRRRQQRRNTVDFKREVHRMKYETKNKNYMHKCAVCGRTDADHPELEFRYCSRCAGYHCFCQDHINNHVHFTE